MDSNEVVQKVKDYAGYVEPEVGHSATEGEIPALTRLGDTLEQGIKYIDIRQQDEREVPENYQGMSHPTVEDKNYKFPYVSEELAQGAQHIGFHGSMLEGGGVNTRVDNESMEFVETLFSFSPLAALGTLSKATKELFTGFVSNLGKIDNLSDLKAAAESKEMNEVFKMSHYSSDPDSVDSSVYTGTGLTDEEIKEHMLFGELAKADVEIGEEASQRYAELYYKMMDEDTLVRYLREGEVDFEEEPFVMNSLISKGYSIPEAMNKVNKEAATKLTTNLLNKFPRGTVISKERAEHILREEAKKSGIKSVDKRLMNEFLSESGDTIDTNEMRKSIQSKLIPLELEVVDQWADPSSVNRLDFTLDTREVDSDLVVRTTKNTETHLWKTPQGSIDHGGDIKRFKEDDPDRHRGKRRASNPEDIAVDTVVFYEDDIMYIQKINSGQADNLSIGVPLSDDELRVAKTNLAKNRFLYRALDEDYNKVINNKYDRDEARDKLKQHVDYLGGDYSTDIDVRSGYFIKRQYENALKMLDRDIQDISNAITRKAPEEGWDQISWPVFERSIQEENMQLARSGRAKAIRLATADTLARQNNNWTRTYLPEQSGSSETLSTFSDNISMAEADRYGLDFNSREARYTGDWKINKKGKIMVKTLLVNGELKWREAPTEVRLNRPRYELENIKQGPIEERPSYKDDPYYRYRRHEKLVEYAKSEFNAVEVVDKEGFSWVEWPPKIDRGEVKVLGGAAGGAGIAEAIDTERPILENEDGSFSTERTITIQDERDGSWHNIPTIIEGTPYSPQEAELMYYKGKNKSVGKFKDVDSAVAAAEARSEEIGRLRAKDREDKREAGLYQDEAGNLFQVDGDGNVTEFDIDLEGVE